MSNSHHSVEQRQQLFTGLYKTAFAATAKYVSRLGGSVDEAKDVFQDALVIYYEKLVAQTLPEKNIAYLIGTAQKLWLHRYRQTKRQSPLDDANIAVTEEQTFTDKRLLKFLASAG